MRHVYLSVRILLFLSLVAPYFNLSAQAEACPPMNVMPIQRVEVTGSLDAGGLPYRGSPSLAITPVGFIPIGTSLTLSYEHYCQDGRNWYAIEGTVTGDEQYNGFWITDGDGYTSWLVGEPFCSAPSIENGRQFFLESFAYVVSTDFRDGRFIFATSPDEVPKHPVMLDYYTLDVETGAFSAIPNPYANILTREVTDELGITDAVYGAESRYQPFSVSPDGSKILYFVPQPPIDACAHGCLRSTAYVADIDGSNPTLLGEVLAYNLMSVEWAANGRIYLTFMAEDGMGWGNSTAEFCLDGPCDATVLEETGIPFEPNMVGSPSVSPDGNRIAFERNYSAERSAGGIVINLEDNSWIELPDNGEVDLPALWLDDDTILYPVDVDTIVERADLGESYYTQDSVWYIDLEFEAQTFAVSWQYVTGDPMMFDAYKSRWFHTGAAVFVMEYTKLSLYCGGIG